MSKHDQSGESTLNHSPADSESDSNERIRAQQLQAYLLKLSDALRPLSDPVAVQQMAMQVLRQHLQVNRAFYGELLDDDDTLRIGPGYASQLSALEGSVSFAAFDSDLVRYYREGQTVVIHDVYQDIELSAQAKAAFDAIQVRAMVGVPLVKDKKVRAILSLHQSVPRRWTNQEVMLLEETAERTWAAVERARAEAALRQSEEKFRTLFTSIDEGYALFEVMYDERGKPVDLFHRETNPAYQQQSGLGDVVGRPFRELIPNLEPWWFEFYAGVARTGQAARTEYHVDAIGRWYTVYASRVGGAGSRQVVAVFDDITERKRQETNLAFLADVGQDLAALTNIDQTMNALGAKIGGHFKAVDVIFGEVSDDGQTVHVNHEWHRADFPTMKGAYAIKAYFSPQFEELHRAGQIAIVRNTAQDERVEADGYAALGIGAFVGVPLIRHNKWCFYFTLLDAKPRDWRPDEIELVRELITRIWARLERARAEEALGESQKRLRLALDASGMGTFLWYPQEDRTEPDARAFTLLGVGENETITLAEALATSIHPDDREVYAAAVASAVDVNGDGKLDLDYRIVQPDGSLHWLHIYGHTIFSGENPTRAALMYGLFLDITGRKRAEANLAFLADVSRDLVHLKTIDETMNALGAKIGRHFTATRCAFFEFNEARDQAVCKYDWHEVNEPSGVGSYRTSDFYTDEFLQIMRAGEAFVVTDREVDSRADATNLAALNIASCIVIPIITGRELLFVLSINDSRTRDWRDDEIELMRELTSRIWARLEGARAEEALRKSEEKFRLLGIASSDSIYRMNPDWTQMHQLMGKTFLADTTDSTSSWLQNYIPLEDQRPVQQVIQEAIRTKSTFELEHRVRRADGTVGWTFSRAIPVLNEQGAIREWMGAASDITARKRAEEALRANEERFRTLIQNLPDYAIFRIDPQGIITEWTEGAQRVKGYTAQEVIGQSIALFYTPEGLAAGELTTERAQAAQQGRAERESVRIRKGGERFWVNEIMTAIHDGAGQLIGFTKISRDITERKVAERVIRDSQQRLQIVLDSIADHAIITTDPQSRITGWNPGAQQLFGYAAGEAIGQSLAIIFTAEDRAAGELEAELAMARGKGRAPDERYHLRKDGSQLYVSGVLSPLYEADGELVGYVKVARDLTERRRMEQALREADGRKDEFLAMLAHELRNPMSTIRSGLQILTLTAGNDQTIGSPGGSATVAASTVALMNRQTDHLVRLVDDLLDVSRISQGKIELKQERLELGSLVSATLDAIRPQFETAQKSLHVSAFSSSLFVQGDSTRLTQVVTNLLSNGLRYTGPQGQVWVSLGEQNGEALLRVRDNGIGLSQSQLTAIFELFVQADNSLARSLGGLGVGLTLTRRLVELHGGQVAASSPGLGQGSTFTVYLPLIQAPGNEPAAEDPAAGSGTAQRVLVIDDNADAALTLSTLLTLKGYEVHCRSTGQQGMQAAESLRPAVILCDIGMPELDGYATCRLIRGQPWGQSMVLIALTGYGQAEDKQRAQEAGFTGHLLKPVDLGALLALLTNVLPSG